MIDCSRANLQDRQWWRRTFVTLELLEQQKDQQLQQLRYQFHLAVMANSRLSGESIQDAEKKAVATYEQLESCIRPWLGRTIQETRQKELHNYRQSYVDNFGVDPADPKFKEWEANRIAELRAASRQTESPEARVNRLLREKIRSRS